MKQITFAFMLTIVSLFIFASCSGTGNSGDEGKLTLNISMSDEESKILLPDIDMTPAYYKVSGSGPAGASFTENADIGTISLNVLDFGTWSITADAYNTADIIIARGTSTAVIHSGQTTTVSIIVKPLSGSGTLNLTVNWKTADIEFPGISAKLAPIDGSPENLNFTISSGTASFSKTNIPAGYYSLTLFLRDNQINVMGTVEIVRIVKDYVTEGTYDFTEINEANGGLDINIKPEIDNPLPIEITGQVPELPVSRSMTVQASCDGAYVGTRTYQWYINGINKSTGPSYTINAADLGPGVYWLDVIVYYGKRAGIQKYVFHVVSNDMPIYPGKITIAVDPSFTEGSVNNFLHFRIFTVGTFQDDYDTTNSIAYHCFIKNSDGSWRTFDYFMPSGTTPPTMFITDPGYEHNYYTLSAGDYKMAMILDVQPSIILWNGGFPFAELGTGDKICTSYITVDGDVTFTVDSSTIFQ